MIRFTLKNMTPLLWVVPNPFRVVDTLRTIVCGIHSLVSLIVCSIHSLVRPMICWLPQQLAEDLLAQPTRKNPAKSPYFMQPRCMVSSAMGSCQLVLVGIKKKSNTLYFFWQGVASTTNFINNLIRKYPNPSTGW